MNGIMKWTALALLTAGGVAACDNRRAERAGGAETGTGSETGTAGDVGMPADTGMGSGTGTAGETGTLSVQDKKEGRVLETPGDSVRLEDTLSDPPPSSDTTKK